VELSRSFNGETWGLLTPDKLVSSYVQMYWVIILCADVLGDYLAQFDNDRNHIQDGRLAAIFVKTQLGPESADILAFASKRGTSSSKLV
jgi:hypothetical protein